MIGHWTCKPRIAWKGRRGQELVKAIAWYLSNSYHRPRSSSFCWFWWDQSWLESPYHRWCTSLPRDINMRGRGVLMTRGLLFKPSDHVIQVPGGIPTSLEPDSLIHLHLSSSPDHQSIRCTRGISLKAAFSWSNIEGIEWVFVLADWALISNSSSNSKSLCQW